MGYKWTDKELKRLNELYPNHHNSDIARELGKPIYLVAYKAKALGLKKAEGHFHWTKDELKYLKKNFARADLTIEEIADHVGRGIKAVRTKANQMGLKRRKGPPRRKR